MIRSIHVSIALMLIFLCSVSHSQEKAKEAPEDHTMKASAVKELNEFHELLHPLVHEAYPNKDFAAIKKALPELIESGTLLKKATLPKELVSKKKAFMTEAKKLMKQLTEMNRKKDTISDEALGKKFMEMHTTFEKMMDMSH